MNVRIEVVEHRNQRYPTSGDWQFDQITEELTIRVSRLGNWRYEMLIAVHELVEFVLCRDRGINEMDVDKFDLGFEARRSFEPLEDEPGDMVSAPYRDEHCFAMGIERLLCSALKISWKNYEDAVERL